MDGHRFSARATEDLLSEIQENHPDIDLGEIFAVSLADVAPDAPETEIRERLADNIRGAVNRGIPVAEGELGFVNFDVIAAQTEKILRPIRLKNGKGEAVLAPASGIPDLAAKMAGTWKDGARLMSLMAETAAAGKPESADFHDEKVSCERIDIPENHESEKPLWRRCRKILKDMLRPARNAMLAAIAFSSLWGGVSSRLPEMRQAGDFRPAIERIVQEGELESAIANNGLLANFMKSCDGAELDEKADRVSDFWNNMGERFGVNDGLEDGALVKYALLRQAGADKGSLSIMERQDGNGFRECLLVTNAGKKGQKAYGSSPRLTDTRAESRLPDADPAKAFGKLDLPKLLGRVLSAASTRADMPYEDIRHNFRREVSRGLYDNGMRRMGAFERKKTGDAIENVRQMRILVEGGEHAGQYTLLPWSAPDVIRELGAKGDEREALGEKFAKCMLNGGRFEQRLANGVKLSCSSIAPLQKEPPRRFSEARKAWHKAEMSDSFRELSALNFGVVVFGRKGVDDRPLAELGEAWKARPFHAGNFQGFLEDFRAAISDGALDRLFREDFALNSLMRRIGGMSPSEKVREIDSFWNRVEYRKDKAGYGQDEYWAKCSEMWLNQYGDCEDYAIAKCATLLRAGFDKNDMQLLIGQTPNDGHAMLAVRLRDGWRILDNDPENSFKAPKDKAAEYVPIAGISQDRVTTYAGPMKFRDPDGKVARPKM